ncbi:MAG: hypothetical protein ACFE8L_10070, partial [Candidatus Hodarchaeota archaeon]
LNSMNEDSALSLKKAYDKGDNIPVKEAQNMLDQSELISKLLETPTRSPDTFVGIRAYEWRLLELSEIPFTNTLEKVHNWLELLVDKSYIQEGFSLEGTKDNLLACHNSLITTILLKMGYDDKEKIDTGIDWILKYQSIERGKECTWPGKDLYMRFGGCMKKVPCYYGVVKAMIALTEYKKQFGSSDEIDNKLNQGLEYILQHRVYKKLSSDKPIESSIILNFYPHTYRSNIIEILSLLKANSLIEDERCKDAIQILKRKQRSDGLWQADISYMKSAWIDFDIPKKPGLWISYKINGLIGD